MERDGSNKVTEDHGLTYVLTMLGVLSRMRKACLDSGEGNEVFGHVRNRRAQLY